MSSMQDTAVGTKRDLDILARTLYGEAEGNNIADAKAIAAVIVNRTRFPNWPNRIAAVCLQAWQFSCWNQSDPNRERILNAHGDWYDTCTKIAGEAISGEMADPTNGATHYYETGIKAPKWAKKHSACHEVRHRGGTAHLFYNDIDTPPPETARQALDQVRSFGQTRQVKGAQVAAGATVLGAAAEAVNQLQPAFPLLQQLALYAPLVLAIITLAGIGWMVWARYDQRRRGIL